MFCESMGDTIQEMLNSELDEELEYDKYDQFEKNTNNSRNGFSQAITAVYPQAIVQRCIVHQIRNSTRYVSYKDIKEFMRDLNSVCQAATLELAERNLDKVGENGKTNIQVVLNHGERNGQN